jgi:hypothetical protein
MVNNGCEEWLGAYLGVEANQLLLGELLFEPIEYFEIACLELSE